MHSDAYDYYRGLRESKHHWCGRQVSLRYLDPFVIAFKLLIVITSSILLVESMCLSHGYVGLYLNTWPKYVK